MKISRAPRFYVYKCVIDDGGAPCVDKGLLSLTICKPYIRSTADKGDWIFAFGSRGNKKGYKNRLVYIAKVTKPRIVAGQYFRSGRFTKRKDCIYRWNGRRLVWRKGALFHKRGSGKRSDLGREPEYPKANALVSSNFRYLGNRGDDSWRLSSRRLWTLVDNLGQGHRVKLSPPVLKELWALRRELWQRYRGEMVIGKPSHPPGQRCSSKERCVSEAAPRRGSKSRRSDSGSC
jgi:hypothetical protein